MNLINQVLNKRENDNYVYILQVRFESNKNVKTLYSVGECLSNPVTKLQEILLSFYEERGYLPKARVLRQRRSAESSVLVQRLKYELMDRRFSFGGLSFLESSAFYDVDEKELLSLYNSTVPDLENMELVDKMPEWAYIQEEKDEITSNCLGENEDYYVVYS